MKYVMTRATGKPWTKLLDYHYQDSVKVNTLIETILKHVGEEKIDEKVQKPLENLKVVCYYGCLLTRPPQVTEAENPENPTDMDELMAALGAKCLIGLIRPAAAGQRTRSRARIS